MVNHLHQKVITNALWEPSGLPLAGYVVFPADVRVVEVPQENQGL